MKLVTIRASALRDLMDCPARKAGLLYRGAMDLQGARTSRKNQKGTLMDQDQQAAQHADETLLQFEMVRVLKEAGHRPLTPDEAMLLAWGAGVANQFHKERT